MIGSQNYIQEHEAICENPQNTAPKNLDSECVTDSAITVFSDNDSGKYLQVSDLKSSKSDLHDSGFSSRASTGSNSPEESPCPSETTNRSCKAKQLDKTMDLRQMVNEKLNNKAIEDDLEDVSRDVDDSLAGPSIESSFTTSNDSGQPMLDKSASSSIQYLEPIVIEPLVKDKLDVPSVKRVEFNISEESLESCLDDSKTFPKLTEENLKLLEEGQTSTPIKDQKKDKAQEGCTPKNTIYMILRLLRVLLCLFFFICSLDLLSSSFQLLGGKTAGKAFQNSDLLKNPICGLMIGVISTAVLQSSSTSTSIVTTMVASDLLKVPQAIPIIMGANIGTSITGVIVSVTQAGDTFVFRRAFSAATVHDTFNWLTVFVLLPIELASGFLYHLTGFIIKHVNLTGGQNSKQEFLKVLTKPITKLLIQLDKKVLNGIARRDPRSGNKSLLKDCSGMENIFETTTDIMPGYMTNETLPVNVTPDLMLESPTKHLFRIYEGTSEQSVVVSTDDQFSSVSAVLLQQGPPTCWYVFSGTALNDQAVGGLVLVIAVALLLTCLTFMVRDLKALLAGQMAKVIQKKINGDFPGKCSYFTGYAFILLGALLTILVQSSSVVVSTLTPLVGVEFVRLERVFPMMLGANLGTTSTAILAAFASTGDSVGPSLQIAFCHLFFNFIGIMIWYPLPFMRKIPLGVARYLGKTTSTYRWFAFMYLIMAFFVIPMSIFGLSVLGWQVLAGVGTPLLLILLLVLVINVIQHKRKTLLPKVLQTWKFLPEFMRSLGPLDRLLKKLFNMCNCPRLCPCCKCCQETKKTYGMISQNTTMTSMNSYCDNESPHSSPSNSIKDEEISKHTKTSKRSYNDSIV